MHVVYIPFKLLLTVPIASLHLHAFWNAVTIGTISTVLQWRSKEDVGVWAAQTSGTCHGVGKIVKMTKKLL